MLQLESRVVELSLQKLKSPQQVYIAYSGGVDSHVLLHLCAPMSSLQKKITAVHVHHGLQAVADVWPIHCRSIAEQLGVDFIDIYVDARSAGRESPEEAARNARYDALKALLSKNDVLMVAQHREDQLETVLLQLFRGAGLQGLSGMPEIMAFGKGVLLRPLLNTPKQIIDQYARQHDLNFIEDPSNQGIDFDRNFLRNEIVPLLKQRWPSIDKTVSRSAVHCAEASELLSKLACDQFKQVYQTKDATLSISALVRFDVAEQALVIRQWFASLGLKMPSRAFVLRILSMIQSPFGDLRLQNQKHTIRRFRNSLFCVPQQTVELPEQGVIWSNSEAPLDLPDGTELKIAYAPSGIDQSVWFRSHIDVRFRSGGEKIGLPNREGRHRLKNLYQEAGIPPWERPYIPLIYLDGRLAAIADLWIGSEFYCENKPGCIRLIRSQKNKNRKGHDECVLVD
ncbi:tRNA lysidine(34) synthetase TilS [Methylotuvimicrobium buryatense]|uniref:tRNA(Ile)-lysidine synthase n=1 Tax=Methylotuvimicrobium buryatense TaxID=95641 RepID=A0A4P9UTX8_METBY|nr:tRNA lysidine(34) synthetase TilS [Methylotuvimicrobium buryatense]QCW83106.1 tRNA lysidine(34) synthetase TilS [Methylotuvimicrobium buryatense]